METNSEFCYYIQQIKGCKLIIENHDFSTSKSRNGKEFTKLAFKNNHEIAGINNHEITKYGDLL